MAGFGLHRMRGGRAGMVLKTMALLTVLLAASCASGRRSHDPALFVPSLWPTDDGARVISSPFGRRKDPIAGDTRFHAGVDIAAPLKSPVYATAHGTVATSGRSRGGYGKVLLIDHGNGYQTLYAHLSRIEVSKGDRVRRGDEIGRVGKTGRATGPHLHYEVRRDGAVVNPLEFLPQ